MIVILTILLVSISYILVSYYKTLFYWHNKGIQYVTPLPIFGNSLALALQRVTLQEYIIDLYKRYPNERYYGTFQYGQLVLLVKQPKLIKRIFIQDFNAFSNHAISSDAEDDSLWGKNLFASSGENWKNLRQTISPFFTIRKMKHMFDLMENSAQQVMDYLKEQHEDMVEVELHDLFKRYSADVIASIAFGIKSNSLKERDNEFIRMGTELTNFGGLQKLKRLLYSVNPVVRKILNLKMHPDNVANFFRNLVKSTIEYRRKESLARPDYIQHLLEARKGQILNEKKDSSEAEFALTKESNLGPINRDFSLKLTDDDITAQALDFFYGGFYSTSSLIVFAMYELAINPKIQEKLRMEIHTTLEENNHRINYEALIRMKYFDMVISETLRKWPTATWIDRKSTEPVAIEPENETENRLLLDPGTICWVPVFAIHRDPKFWPNPEKFNPERFNEENRSNIHSYTFLPFGAGPRNCIGSRFAIMEAKLVIYYILSYYEIVPTEKSCSENNPFLTSSSNFWFGMKRNF